MKIRNIKYDEKQASENISKLLNPVETQQEKNERIKQEVLGSLE